MIGRTLSHYRVLEKIGEGATGVVYKAEDLSLGRPVALKFLPLEISSNGSALLRFQLEARVTSSLNHPNICTVYEIAQHEGQQFIVMELLEGQLLSQAIGGRPLPLDEVLELGIQISDGLDAAHAEGIVHGDLKPANIFVTRRGQAKILDFGLAQLAPRRSAPREHEMQVSKPGGGGTVPYMSPEQLRGEDLDPRADLFSLGVVLYEMTTGRRAFNGRTGAEIRDAISNQVPHPPRLVNPALPAEMDRIVSKALEKNRKLRFQTASDLRADLQRFKRDFDSDRSGSASSAGVRAPTQKRSFRWPAAVVGGIVMTALALGYSVAVRQPDQSATTRAPVQQSQAAAIDPPDAPVARSSEPPTGKTRSASAPPSDSSLPSLIENPSGSGRSGDADRLAARQELRIARTKADAGLHDQALATLRDLVVKHGQTDEALEAYFLMSSIQESQKLLDDAMGTYLEIADRYRAHARAPEALFRLANLTLRSDRAGKELQARQLLAKLVNQYGSSAESVGGHSLR